MSTARTVRTIPPIQQRAAAGSQQKIARKRVAAYARVSTDSDEQFTSFEAQVDYYTRKIRENSEWVLVEVYTDEGISATNTKKRDGFNRMIADALDGKIDLILTKSISRFARNTVDTLTTVRNLKAQNIEVYFEKENILTLDAKGELLITIMSSLAQEESRSISENVSWGKRAKAAEGKVYLPYKRFLGYEKGENGLPQIVDREAKIVRMIYRAYLEGKTPSGVARQLTKQGVPTPAGLKVWQSSTVNSILTNDKYKGDAILQKTFCTDFLTKTMKVNEGELPQYYVEQSHPAIIEPELFDLVQHEMKRRKESGHSSRDSCFSGKIVCGQCGAFYGSKVWHSNSKYRRTIWQCNSKYKDGTRCSTQHLYEDEIKATFLDLVNGMVEDRDVIIADYKVIIRKLADTKALDEAKNQLMLGRDVVLGQIRGLVDENAKMVLDQEEYGRRYTGLVERYDALQVRLAEIDTQRYEWQVRLGKMDNMVSALANGMTKNNFDERLWVALVERVVVTGDGGLAVEMKDGFSAVSQ